MSTLLLQTKLHIPPVPPHLVHRPRLVDRLGEHVTARVTLFSAPAGFGKTTLLGEWASQIKQRDPRVRVAWLALDEGDDDPARFFAYLIAALQTIDADAGKAAHVMLQSTPPPSLDTVMGALINDLDSRTEPFALVVDDYHLVQAQAIHHALAFLLENLPSCMHVIIAGRADPPIPLARLRAHGLLTEIRADDLRFTTEEAATFLSQFTRLNLSADDIATLEARTEGWVAGLQMAALSLRGQKDVAGFIRAFGGSHRYVLDYLVEQVLDQQPAPIQQFLLQTSILDRLTASLCAAVVGGKTATPDSAGSLAPENAQQVLEHLDSSNLFIVPLDTERRWYRYHRLFADLLRYRLQQSADAKSISNLHHRAADWLEKNGLPADAVNHLLAAGDSPQAARLIEQIGPSLFWTEGQVATLLHWAHELPDEQIRTRPRLSLTLAWAEMTAVQLDTVIARLSDVEQGIGAVDSREQQTLRGELATLRVMLANFRGDPHVIELSQAALAQLPADALFLRCTMLGNLGGAYAARGEATAACQAFAEASRMGRQVGNTFVALGALAFLGETQAQSGHLHAAAETFQQALDLAVAQGALQVSFAGMANIGMGKLFYEWNHLDKAARYLMGGIELGEEQAENLTGPGWQMLAAGYLAYARLLHARREMEQALDTIRKAETLARLHDPAQLPRIAAARARVEWAAGNGGAVTRWMQESGVTADDDASYAREFEHLTLARVLIGRGHGDAAARLLERIEQAAEPAGRTETVIEACVLQALALSARDREEESPLSPESASSLQRALVLAEPEDYCRMFVDEGAAMAKMLEEMSRRLAGAHDGRMSKYISRLLAALADKEAVHPSSRIVHPSLVEPLSSRELEVLRLIVDGDSNREIAEKLVITVTTVKKHVSNIFGKLGVTSRTQAIARAREMGLT